MIFSRLPAAFFTRVLFILPMITLASLERTTKRGLHSVWHFVQAPDGYYAFGGCHKPLVKRFDTVDGLRELYSSYLGYGYHPLAEDMAQLELPLTA